MKTVILAATLCTSVFAAPAFAQAAPEAKEEKAAVAVSANEAAAAAMADMLAVFKAISNADSPEAATAAAKEIEAISAKFEAHEKALNAAKAPTAEDKKAIAVKMVDMEEGMEPLQAKIEANMVAAGQEGAEAIGMAMMTFQQKAVGAMMKLAELYPDGEMEPLIKAEKEKRAAAKEEKAEEKK